MLYALDEINADPTILPNISLGAMILDTCSNPSYAFEQSMEFVRAFMDSTKEKDQENINSSTVCDEAGAGPSQPVAGVIGASFSGVSIMVANILKLFKVRKFFIIFSTRFKTLVLRYPKLAMHQLLLSCQTSQDLNTSLGWFHQTTFR